MSARQLWVLVLVIGCGSESILDMGMTDGGVADVAADERSDDTSRRPNRPPSAQAVRIEGQAVVGETLSLRYEFEDLDGEGESVIVWSTRDDEVQRGADPDFVVPSRLLGQEIGAWVWPVDSLGLEGDMVAATNNYLRIARPPSVHLRPIELPACHALDPNVVFIRSDEDWERINDEQTVYCVSAGDYASLGPIEITSSGTEEHPRYLLLDNGNDEHPAALDASMRARYRLLLQGANHWVIDRQSYWQDPLPTNTLLAINASSDNVFNRAYFADTGAVVKLTNGSHRNSIQQFHMERTQWSVDYAVAHRAASGLPPYHERVLADLAAIGFVGNRPGDTMLDNHVVGNEIINYVDAFQLVRIGAGDAPRADPNPRLDGAGTLIADNLFYTTSLMYTDGTGAFSPDGDRAVTENAMDFKFGSLDPDRPVHLVGNVMFGYRFVDNSYSSLADNGNAMVFHFGAGGFLIEDNYVFDCRNGYSVGGPRGADPAFYDVVMRNNVFTGLLQNIQFVYGTPGATDGSANILLTSNVFGSTMQASLHAYNSQGLTIRQNAFVNTRPMYFAPAFPELRSSGLSIESNTFYDSPEMGIPDFANATENTHSDISFDWGPFVQEIELRRFTESPIVMSIPPLG